jgi:hypothetical protein
MAGSRQSQLLRRGLTTPAPAVLAVSFPGATRWRFLERALSSLCDIDEGTRGSHNCAVESDTQETPLEAAVSAVRFDSSHRSHAIRMTSAGAPPAKIEAVGAKP